MFELSSTDCLSLNLDDPVNVYLHEDVSKTKKVTETDCYSYTVSTLSCHK